MTLGELRQRAKERVSELNAACDSIDPKEREFDEVCGRHEEAKVFLELISECFSDSLPLPIETKVSCLVDSPDGKVY